MTDKPKKPPLKPSVAWSLFAVGVTLLLGGLLPWAASVGQISRDEEIRSLSWTAIAGGAVILLLALVNRAPRTTGCLTWMVGVLCGSFVFLGILSAFWGPPLGFGIPFALLGSLGAFLLGPFLVLVVVGRGEEALRVEIDTATQAE
jgi:hypothetical protein